MPALVTFAPLSRPVSGALQALILVECKKHINVDTGGHSWKLLGQVSHAHPYTWTGGLSGAHAQLHTGTQSCTQRSPELKLPLLQ